MDAEYQPIRPFDIDNGQLDGISPQQCFVLGYELCQIDSLLAQPKAFAKPVHAENRDRIASQCEREGRSYEIDWMPDDKSESWLWLSVEGD